MMRALLIALLSGILFACGGGDDSGSTGNPPANPPANPSPGLPAIPPTPLPPDPSAPPATDPATPGPRLVLSTNTLHSEAWVIARAGQLSEVRIDTPGQVSPLYLGGGYSTSGIYSVEMSTDGSSLRIVPRAPYGLRPGTYTDTITVRACLEWPCVTQISGSPQTISVTYTVRMPAEPPRLTLLQENLVVQGQVLDPGNPPDQLLPLMIQAGELTTWVQPALSTSSNGLLQARFRSGTIPQGHGGHIVLTMKAPATLGVGVFTDTVTVRACLDEHCVNELAGSPATVTIQYTVTDAVPGAEGYRSRVVAVDANDIVWDERRKVLYLSMGSASAQPNTIAVLDPVSGAFTSYAPVGSNPGRLALSPDGNFLYVALRGTGAFQRLLLPSLAVDLTVPLGTRFDGAEFTARELRVSPADSRMVAVVRAGHDTPWDLAIFHDATMRPQTVGGSFGPNVTTVQWESATRLFGANSYTSAGTAAHIGIDENGARITASQEGVTSFDGGARLAAGRIYMERGRVFDPVTFAQIGFLPVAGVISAGITVDEPNGKVFLVSGPQLRSFDLTTLAPLASIWLPRASPLMGTTHMVRWGEDGLAILNYQDPMFGTRQLLLIDGAFVKP